MAFYAPVLGLPRQVPSFSYCDAPDDKLLGHASCLATAGREPAEITASPEPETVELAGSTLAALGA